MSENDEYRTRPIVCGACGREIDTGYRCDECEARSEEARRLRDE